MPTAWGKLEAAGGRGGPGWGRAHASRPALGLALSTCANVRSLDHLPLLQRETAPEGGATPHAFKLKPQSPLYTKGSKAALKLQN